MILTKGLFVVTEMINKKINTKRVHFLFGEYYAVDSIYRQSVSDCNICQTMNVLAKQIFVLKFLVHFCFVLFCFLVSVGFSPQLLAFNLFGLFFFPSQF